MGTKIQVGDKFVRQIDLPSYEPIRVLAIAEGWALVRRYRAMTWAVSLREIEERWRRISDTDAV